MNLARSTYYDADDSVPEDAVVTEIREIVGAFRGYGYRRVAAELRHRGQVVNSKKVRRIMREKGLNPKRRRRHVVTCQTNWGVDPLSEPRNCPPVMKRWFRRPLAPIRPSAESRIGAFREGR